MRVLVTGSAGNIGREQVKALLAAGHEIRTLDRAAGRKENAWEHISGDIRDIYTVRKAAQGMDAVVHLGAIADDRHGADDDVLTVNVQGTWNVLIACAEVGVGRVVFYSSVNALGNFKGHRPSEILPIDDSYPRHPMTAYQLSKHLGEETCRSFSDRYGMVTICLRPVWVVQPDHYAHLRRTNSERRTEWGRHDYWAYVDVRDVCAAGVLGLTVENVLHTGFLLAADDTHVEPETAELVAKYYPETPWKQDRETYLAENVHRSLIDCTHAKQALGWQPKYHWRTAEALTPLTPSP